MNLCHLLIFGVSFLSLSFIHGENESQNMVDCTFVNNFDNSGSSCALCDFKDRERFPTNCVLLYPDDSIRRKRLTPGEKFLVQCTFSERYELYGFLDIVSNVEKDPQVFYFKDFATQRRILIDEKEETDESKILSILHPKKDSLSTEPVGK
jgi:hypothetical protein